MNTPIFDFVRSYTESDTSRFHMPGHKGKSFLGCESLDITEINGADILGAASGIIAQSEKNAASLFGSAYTFYSTEGSSLSIKAMLALVKKGASPDERVKILASRNVHKAFIYACALLDIDVEWLCPKDFAQLYSYTVTPSELEDSLSKAETLPHAFYLTSPDYLGNMADIKALADVCHKHGVPLLVDNAHGAYLSFLETSLHPIDLGADMCCDSAHKTLPVLTGGAYLHVAKGYDVFSEAEIRGAMALFASTSPSYLILQSLDLCNAYLADNYKSRLAACIAKTAATKEKLSSLGFKAKTDCEPLKIVVEGSSCGYSGIELAQVLANYNVEVEFADENNLVLMITPELDDKDFDRVLDAFSSLAQREPDKGDACTTPWESPVAKTSIRSAILSKSEIVSSSCAEGRICASPAISFPPAVPIVVSGELITEQIIKTLLYYGIENIDVLK